MFLPHWGYLGRCGTTLGGRNTSGQDRCVREESKRTRNSPEVSGRFWRFLGVSGMMLLESSRRTGSLIYKSGWYSSFLISCYCEKSSCTVTSFVGILYVASTLRASPSSILFK